MPWRRLTRHDEYDALAGTRDAMMHDGGAACGADPGAGLSTGC